MNKFLSATIKLINMHGVACTYKKTTLGEYDPSTGSVSNTTTNYSVISYPKITRADQYNYPNLIGRELIIFYLAKQSFEPSNDDKIQLGSTEYVVQQVTPVYAKGEVVLYKLLAVR